MGAPAFVPNPIVVVEPVGTHIQLPGQDVCLYAHTRQTFQQFRGRTAPLRLFRGEHLREAAGLVGMEKLMWGSDYPRTITAITYKMSYDFIVKSPDLQEDEKRLFLGENARKFYGFTDLPILPYIKNMSE